MEGEKMLPKLYRHGDVLIQETEEIPKKAKKITGNILVEGEITGHAHRLTNSDSFQIFHDENIIFIEITQQNVQVIHEEHEPITLPIGKYKVWVQREYTPKEIRRVID